MASISVVWVSRVLSALVVLFLLADAIMKILRLAPVLASMQPLGLDPALALPLGVLLLLCTVLYAMPATAALGAVLLTGYLGGAAAIHVRVGNPLFTHALFSVYLGVALWLALWLRMPALRALLPLTRR